VTSAVEQRNVPDISPLLLFNPFNSRGFTLRAFEKRGCNGCTPRCNFHPVAQVIACQCLYGAFIAKDVIEALVEPHNGTASAEGP
jgi:hypothetical protein